MEILQRIIDFLRIIAPMIAFIAATILAFIAISIFFARKPKLKSRFNVLRSLMIAAIIITGIIGVLFTLPVLPSTRNSLMTVLGIIISATITLASTTFVGNAMAGVMLRYMRNFNPGDFIQVDEYFGRISEQGIFHMEIQTEESNLTTLPNLFIISRPMTVIRSTGTVVSANVSLGYDIPHAKIERLLCKAAEETGLKEPYIQILELGDFSVTYRCAGLLEDAKQILAARAKLRVNMLDALHMEGIEIVSPNFMNQRVFAPDKIFAPLPETQIKEAATDVAMAPNDELIFGKAERAASIEELKKLLEQLQIENDGLEKSLHDVKDEQEHKRIENKISENKTAAELIKTQLDEASKADKEPAVNEASKETQINKEQKQTQGES